MLKKELRIIINKPLETIRENGGITAISEKSGAYLGRFIGGIIENIALPIVAICVFPVALVIDSLQPNKEPEETQINPNSKHLIPIKPIAKINSLRLGIKNDILEFFSISNDFTEDFLDEKYKLAIEKFHPDRNESPVQYAQMQSLYEELKWKFFKPTNDEERTRLESGNYPKLREKSYNHTPTYKVNQFVFFQGRTVRVAQTSSCKNDGYFLVDNEGGYYENVNEQEIRG